MNQQSPKKIAGPGNSGLEFDQSQSIGFQVVRPPGQTPPTQHGHNESQNQIGQGIVPQGQPTPLVRHEPQFANDDISTFFRNRQMVAQGSFGLNPILKFFILICVIAGSFIVAWNYVEPVRKHSQKFAYEYLEFNLVDYIPAWSKRAKAYHRRSEKELEEKAANILQTSLRQAEVPLDPTYIAVTAGFWPQVDAFIAAKCPRWDATSGCAVKAWYLSYRGMRPSLRPVQSLNAVALSKLSVREQAIFNFAKATLFDGPLSEQLFRRSLDMSAKDLSFRKMLFDARLKWILKENKTGQIPEMISLARDLSASTAEISKWRSLEMATRVSTAQKPGSATTNRSHAKQISETMRTYAGHFKSDPVAFIMIAGPGLRLGLAKQVAVVGEALAKESFTGAMDPSLRRELNLLTARALMIEGELNNAAERIKMLQRKDGVDAVANHLLGAIYLEMRSPGKLNDAIYLFQQAAKVRNSWQSHAGLLMAQTRLGKISEGNKTASTLLSMKNNDSDVWIQVIVAEYKLAVAKAGGDLSLARYKEVADSLSGLYARYPHWRQLAEVYAEALANSGQIGDAEKVRLKMDDVSSKKSYLSSSEYLESPIGPFVMMR